MKKLIALVLALVMVLGLGVVAFADVLPGAKIDVVVLQKEDDDDDPEPDEILNLLEVFGYDATDPVFLACPYSRDYYFELDNYDDFKNYTVTTTGPVTAEIVEFNGEELYYTEDYRYKIVDTKNNDEVLDKNDILGIIPGYEIDKAWWDANGDDDASEWDAAQDVADDLNNAVKEKGRFEVRVCDKNDENKYHVALDKHLLKVTTADNFSAAYKEGTVKLTATKKAAPDKNKTFTAEFTVISDVTIFEYEEVKWAADNEPLTLFEGGYSDYLTAKNGYAYGTNGNEYVIEDLRVFPGATVVSTTAFRAVEGQELEVEHEWLDNYFVTVTIDEVAKGQKGVNFFFEGPKFYDEDGDELDWDEIRGSTDKFEFGFLGDQVIASDFEIEVELPLDYFQLRELFGKKIEEEDIITYYVLKDGVKYDEITVDYKDDEVDEDVVLEILGKAGDKLGYYTITLNAPAEEGEENPNTGAESMIGVVAAMAVVSLAAAAAVSLKK